MLTNHVHIIGDNIRDWPTFHDEFMRVFGFPEFYGRNMDAWIDCLTYIDDPDDAMSEIHCDKGTMLTIEVRNALSFQSRSPEQFSALVECADFVNARRLKVGEPAVLSVTFTD
jgi:barstar (barnase inhibitor)